MATMGYKPTPDFAAAVSSGNLLRTRIMLKDSMLLDPTRKQFDEMVEYAKGKLPNLFVPYDGETLETDTEKWNLELMNRELSQLVSNFSCERIEHLWKVIRQVRADDIRRREYLEKRREKSPPITPPQRSSGSSFLQENFSVGTSNSGETREQALERIQAAGEKIVRIMRSREGQGKNLTSNQVSQMKEAAKEIVDAAKQYKKNS